MGFFDLFDPSETDTLRAIITGGSAPGANTGPPPMPPAQTLEPGPSAPRPLPPASVPSTSMPPIDAMPGGVTTPPLPNDPGGSFSGPPRFIDPGHPGSFTPPTSPPGSPEFMTPGTTPQEDMSGAKPPGVEGLVPRPAGSPEFIPPGTTPQGDMSGAGPAAASGAAPRPAAGPAAAPAGPLMTERERLGGAPGGPLAPQATLPPGATPTVGPPMRIGPPGGVAPGVPTMPPGAPATPVGPNSFIPMTPTGLEGLFQTLGIRDPQQARQAAVGLAAGLKAAGKQPGWLGAAAGAAGENLAAQQGETEKEFQRNRVSKDDLFKQSSTAFQDMIKARAAGDASAYNKARADYFDARAKSITAGGGSNAWQNTTFGRSVRIESDVDKWGESQRKAWTAGLTSGAMTKEDYNKNMAGLDAAKEAERVRRYQAAGINPKDRPPAGTSTNDAFVAGKHFRTEEEFKAIVPPGGIYKDVDGKFYRRKKEEKKGQAEHTNDDWMASQGPAEAA